MKYLTKEWYELSQQTRLDFNMKVNNGTAVFDEALYMQLYKIKEEEFVKIQNEIYDTDPSFLLTEDGSTLVRPDKFTNDEEIIEEDKMIYHMPQEEKERIQKLVGSN